MTHACDACGFHRAGDVDCVCEVCRKRPAARFAFRCSYQGCVWFSVTDATGTYEVEFRHSLPDYERKVLNGGAQGEYAKEVEALIGWLVPRHRRENGPVPAATVRAWNAWRVAECKAWLRKLTAEPERYGAPNPDDSRPRYLALGSAYWHVTLPPTQGNGWHCEGHWRFEALA